ncbi:Ras family protein [Histomonas meleagridis]|uniref:Ras family protein n=1 Tax=Histomonas meleagridis TaxID=135588 RepID=UPI00355A76FD|nr:Ras family protein [Histomonas meleagridis]
MTTFACIYFQGNFHEFCKTTIGVDFGSKEYPMGDQILVAQLWDIAAQERYGNMIHVYYQESVGAVIVFGANHPNELDFVELWKKDIETKVFTSEGKPILILLVGCLKGDVDERWKSMEERYRKYSEEKGFIGYFTVNLNTGSNVEESISSLVKYVYDNGIQPQTTEYARDLQVTPKNTKREVCYVQ